MYYYIEMQAASPIFEPVNLNLLFSNCFLLSGEEASAARGAPHYVIRHPLFQLQKPGEGHQQLQMLIWRTLA